MCVRQAPRLEPLKVKDSRPRVYCWHRHARFVSEWLAQTVGADVNVRGVAEPDALLGLEDATFVQVRDIDTPNDRHSDALADIAMRQGFTLVTIYDFPKRRGQSRC